MKQTDQAYEQQLSDLYRKLEVIQRDQTSMLLQAVASYELVKEVTGVISRSRNIQGDANFNKVVYPKFLSLLIYYRHVVVLFSGEPLNRREQISCLKELRKKLEAFRQEHHELIQYCRSGATDRDAFYFGVNAHQVLLPEESPVYVWSKYLASQKLNDLIEVEIGRRKAAMGNSDLMWTAPKTNLIELLYALHATNVFNDGKAGIKQLAEAFEKIFQVSLGNYYRVFQDIRQRKINQTFFLDQLKEKFMHRIQDLE